MDTAMHMLYRLLALLAFAASALGCDHPHRSFTQRSTVNGVDQLDSRVEITASGAHFDCRASRSGQCHYSLFAAGCDRADDCRIPALKTLAVPAGSDRDITHLPAVVQVCVRTDDAAVDARCRALAPGA